MPTNEEIWERILQGADEDLACTKDIQTSDKEISMWLEREGVPTVPPGEFSLSNWNSAEFLIGAMNLQKDLTRGHRRLCWLMKVAQTHPAREIVWDSRREPDRARDVWEAGLRATTFAGASTEKMAALHLHPVWQWISEIGRPFQPLFPISSWEEPGAYEESVDVPTARSWGLINPETNWMWDPANFQPWPNDGRVSMTEWLVIYDACCNPNSTHLLRPGRRAG